MFTTLADSVVTDQDLTWEQVEPYYLDLQARHLDGVSIVSWLADWTALNNYIVEIGTRLHVLSNQDTTDEEVERRFFAFLEQILPRSEAADQQLKEKLLSSGSTPPGMEIPLRNLRAEADLFRQENLPLQVELNKLSARYDKIVGAQTVLWEGEEIPVPRLRIVLEGPDRDQREKAWWLARERQLADRQMLNDLWVEMVTLRQTVAHNAGLPDYRAYAWQAYHRFDYTPEDCQTFHAAIEAVCVPAATRIYERHRKALGMDRLRPWDLTNGSWGRPSPPPGRQPLKPYTDVAELLEGSVRMFNAVDPQLGNYLETMVVNQLLDVENRPGKAPGGYCTYFPVSRQPFVFMNSVGTHNDVQTMMHEAGHAFHAFEKTHLPYHPQYDVPMEFNEVASMSMELLAAPYLEASMGGFYSPAEAALARIEHLEDMILFWPYMAVMDAFQHWAYTHPEAAVDTRRCDEQWQALWRRFLPGIDWSGLEAELVTGWHRQLHIFHVPFYYVEYGLAALGAVQVWQGSLADQASSIAAYRRALALGGTAPLPQLFATAGARFAFDAETLGKAIHQIEAAIAELLAVALGEKI